MADAVVRAAAKRAHEEVLSSPEFIGRKPELARLRGAFAKRPAMVLVEGEAGIGKSRLLREFLASSVTARHAVMVSCPPFRQPFTLGPIVDALRQVGDRIAGLRLSPLAGALRPLFPEWAGSLPPLPDPLEDATAARHRLFRALHELLVNLDVRILVIDDAHWADDATLEFLLFLMSHQSRRSSVIMTYRPEDVPPGSLLLRLSSRAIVDTAPLRITLAPLDVAETAQLVSSMVAGGPVSDVFARYLHEHTDGLPLAVEETVRLLRDRRDVRRRGNAWVRRTFDQLAVPATVRDAVVERYQRLGSEARRILQAAAVLTEPSEEPVLIDVSGLDGNPARTGLGEALASGLVAESDRGLIGYRHSMACRVVYDAIPASDRRHMHLRAATGLEQRQQATVPQLARHFREANQDSKWSEYAERAADIAEAAGDDTTAIALLNELLATAKLSASSRGRLAKKLAGSTVKRRSESVDLATRTVQTIRTILGGTDLGPQDTAEIRSLLGRLLQQLGDFDGALAELELAIPRMAHLPAEQVRMMVSLSDPRIAPWPVETHLDWLRRAADASTALPRSERLSFAVARSARLLQFGEDAGWELAARAITEAIDAGELRLAMVCALNTGGLAMAWGRFDEARVQLRSALELADLGEHLRLRNAILASVAHLDWLSGVWAGLAERVALLVGADDAQPADQQEAALVAGVLEAMTGDRRAARQRLRLLVDSLGLGSVPDLAIQTAAALARLCLLDGRAEDALALAGAPVALVAGKGMWMWATDIVPVYVQALVDAGRLNEAADLVAAFTDGIAGRRVPAPAAALLQCRASVEAGRSECTSAVRLFARSSAAWRRLPRPYDALLCREAQARCMMHHDRDAALSLLGEVLTGFSELGAIHDADRVAARLREHGVKAARVWRGGRRGYGDQLSPRELEVVRLVATGLTNREVAVALHRSPKTVDSQLNSAMRKLGVSSRTALAVSAVEAGILAAADPRDDATM